MANLLTASLDKPNSLTARLPPGLALLAAALLPIAQAGAPPASLSPPEIAPSSASALVLPVR